MKIELEYQITCKIVRNERITFKRETPGEILDIWRGEIQVLEDMEKETPDRVKVHAFTDETNKYFPKGTITAILDGDEVFYELKTIITEL